MLHPELLFWPRICTHQIFCQTPLGSLQRSPDPQLDLRGHTKCPQKLRELAYISLIRSKLEYCAAVWDRYLIKDINILEGIQRRPVRLVIQDHSRFTKVSSLVKDLNWALGSQAKYPSSHALKHC